MKGLLSHESSGMSVPWSMKALADTPVSVPAEEALQLQVSGDVRPLGASSRAQGRLPQSPGAATDAPRAADRGLCFGWQWAATATFIFVSFQVDPVFTREVKAKVKRAAGVRLIGEMPQGDLHAAVKNCFAVVNSSVSEGMSAAILENVSIPAPLCSPPAEYLCLQDRVRSQKVVLLKPGQALAGLPPLFCERSLQPSHPLYNGTTHNISPSP
ncbi:hypothetical protein P7K49_020596 [Saguinus oedipus]|uniref:Uncharacterized protein n=1 Tax=Saguinus oedipus TaxID=9490 RepID=A0ABQ9V0Q5_SAGOE|nr:hypothetical protein P7K49_020596 [Saguinus oedipus]